MNGDPYNPEVMQDADPRGLAATATATSLLARASKDRPITPQHYS